MDYFLIEGAANVGKTTTIVRLANRFLENGYKIVKGKVPAPNSKNDFIALLEKGGKRVVFNSASDTFSKIDDCKTFCDKNQPVNLLISSCREDKYLYNHFFQTIIEQDKHKGKLLEFPLAKITRRSEAKKASIKWYKTRVDEILRLLLKDEFNIVLK